MREIRSSGSVEGVLSNGHPYSDSRPTASPVWQESQLWHRDYTDSRILKLFIYLDDVDDEAGPFTFIPAQHSATIGHGHFLPRRISDEEMARKGGSVHARTIRGKAGTAFFVDTARCYHLGSRCKTQQRIVYIAQYNTMAELTRYDLPASIEGMRLSPLQHMAVRCP